MDRINLDRLQTVCQWLKDGKWEKATEHRQEDGTRRYSSQDGAVCAQLTPSEYGWEYELETDSEYDTQVRLSVFLPEKEENRHEEKAHEKNFHVIPCNIYGDNNIDRVKPGEFPSLTWEHQGTRFCSPFWEFRADRAAVPASMVSGGDLAAGIWVDPYAKEEETGTWIHNGVFAALPGEIGVSLGYINLPATFVDKGNEGKVTAEYVKRAVTRGEILLVEGKGRQGIHEIVQRVYDKLHCRAGFTKRLDEAARAIVDACVEMNWSEEWQAYTDMSCCPPEKKELKPWRPVNEIGWTGIAELACPFIMAEKLLGIGKEQFGSAKDGWELFDQIAASYCQESGLLYDLVAPVDETGSLINGWWVYYYIGKERHCAYTNGKAVYAMLKTIFFLKERKEDYPVHWLETCERVLDTMLELQRGDGNYGYTYSTTEKKVLDWDGFAGCWFLPAMVYAYRITGKEKYLDSARKAEGFYEAYVNDLNCYSTPMDTWKAVDEEGNLAFVRGTRLLHETTGERHYLEALEAGAHFEYLWRYGYAARPENAPLKDGWNSCGGSVTSISNPHIHPMGVLIDTDLRYLAGQTGKEYHRMRADDGTAWLMQCLELYPEKSGYGRYGMISERFCPSDGLVTERYSDGRPFSSWFTFNLWATANVLEAIMDKIEEDGTAYVKNT